MNQAIAAELKSEVPVIEQISQHLINSGGKRLRPALTLLASGAMGYRGDEHILVAAVIEFFHTSTLLHDDVVDQSDLRRGKPTANALWGNATSVLVGDFLLSKSFELVVRIGKLDLMRVLAEATRTISEGEVMQLTNAKNPDITEDQYMKVIEYKTAKLFEAAAITGGMIATTDQKQLQTLACYGRRLGNAFQLIDDLLDYSGSSQTLGKNVGDDLAEGKPTLPLVYTITHGKPDEQQLVRHAIKSGCLDVLDDVREAARRCGALDYCFRKAAEETHQAVEAISTLGDSDYKASLIELAQASLDRCA